MKEYIERKRAIVDACNALELYPSEYAKLEDALNKIPAVDVAPVVHGRWVGWGKSGTPTYENYGTCSVCGEDAEIYTEHRNYCPNCGADMRGINDE